MKNSYDEEYRKKHYGCDINAAEAVTRIYEEIDNITGYLSESERHPYNHAAALAVSAIEKMVKEIRQSKITLDSTISELEDAGLVESYPFYYDDLPNVKTLRDIVNCPLSDNVLKNEYNFLTSYIEEMHRLKEKFSNGHNKKRRRKR